jgi:phosphoglycolate phosphatase-like HAD superfamily hydrolase
MTKTVSKSVFLDWDGTLLDAFPIMYEAINKTREQYGLAALTKQEALKWSGEPDDKKVPKDFSAAQADDAKQHFFKVYSDVAKEKGVSLMPGAENLLNFLKEKRENGTLGTLGIISNKDISVLEKDLEAFGLKDVFDVVIGSEDEKNPPKDPDKFISVKKGKPSTDAFDAAKAHSSGAEVRGANTIYIGDTDADKEFADNIGVKFLGVGEGFSPNKLSPEEQVTDLEAVQSRLTHFCASGVRR